MNDLIQRYAARNRRLIEMAEELRRILARVEWLREEQRKLTAENEHDIRLLRELQ